MKKSTTIAMMLLIAASATMFNGCKKEKVKGCMDSSSKNYNPKAEEDDGSCSYSGSCVFWILAGDISSGESANVYLDGVLQGNVSVTFYNAPSCDETGALTVHKDMGRNKYGNYSFVLKPVFNGYEYNDPADWLTASISFTGNGCTQYRIQ